MNIDEINRIILKEKTNNNINAKEISDGYHTFGELYKHRIILFCVLCNTYKDISWKSKKHFDEENDSMFNGSFIAGINTPDGEITYHIKLDYWDLFDITELEHAPKYDGHTSDDVLVRLLSLTKDVK